MSTSSIKREPFRDQLIVTGLLSKFGSAKGQEGHLLVGIARLIVSYHPATCFVDLFDETYRTQLYQELYSVCKNDPLLRTIKLQFMWPVLLEDNQESPELIRQRLAKLQQGQVTRINKFLNTRLKRIPQQDRTISVEEFNLLTLHEKLNKFMDLWPRQEIRFITQLNQGHPNNPNIWPVINNFRAQRSNLFSYLFTKKTVALITERCAKAVNEATAQMQLPPNPALAAPLVNQPAPALNPALANQPQPQLNLPLRQRIFNVLKQFAFYFVVGLVVCAVACIFALGLVSLASRVSPWLKPKI